MLSPRAVACVFLPLLVAGILLVAGLPQQAQADSSAGSRSASRTFKGGDDWRHLKLVLATLEASPPKRAVVYLLGGSAAREATTSDGSWTRQLRRLTGERVRAFNLGTSGQSYDQSISIVRRLPSTPAVVLIGVNLGRYTQRERANPDTSAGLPGGNPSPVASTALYAYRQHRFTSRRVRSSAKKRELLRKWKRERYPVFKRRYAYNRAALSRLIVACQDSGLQPVLVNLPINRQLIRHALDAPCRRYAATSRRARLAFGIRSWDFVSNVRLNNRDFVDLWHLVGSGRVKYQRRLSERTAAALREYGLVQ